MSGNLATATRTCRLLYYGSVNTGKRDNLRIIHQSVPPEHKLAIACDDPERHIAFRVRHENKGDWQVLVQTVDTGKERFRTAGMPGQPVFDGIIMVVKSGASLLDQSLSTLESLKNYLDSWGQDLMSIPVVIQYNGREEADTLPVDRLESLLNPWGLLSYPASTVRSEGVKETLKAALGLTINHLTQNPMLMQETVAPVAPLPAQVPASQQNIPRPQLSQVIVQKPTGGSDLLNSSPLGLEYGPPLPGTEESPTTYARSQEILGELNPPIVVPVRIPRRLVNSAGPLNIVLEVVFDDDERI